MTAPPVIALTAHALEESLGKCLDAGCTAYVLKPATRDVLWAAILEALGNGPEKSEESFVVEADLDLEPLLPGYVQGRREDCRTIRDALERGDYDEIRTLGHRMKGSGGGYGMDAVSEIGGDMESAALEKDSEKIRKLADRLMQFCNKCIFVRK